ncbi:MAG: ATP-binding cassette domain-containing protein [Synergistaceae bacterium]|jgi:ABC-type glutathione transport system ATPase component|nr:ATP-binding cassette domain-containing protein [Synergistaceae bacterium]
MTNTTATGKTPVLEVSNLSISFRMYDRGFRKRTSRVISDLSVSIAEGKILAVVGASGSGKSLLAHAVLGILPENASVEGEMKYYGQTLSAHLQESIRGSQMALVPQSVSYFNPLMRMKFQILGTTGAEERMKSILERYGLDENFGRLYPFQLSGGMTRRALIATAVIGNPKLVIADEPTPGLTPELAHETMNQFKELAAQGCAIMLITHDIDLAFQYADDVAVLYEGVTVDTIPSSDFKSGKEKLKHPYSRALWEAMPQNEFRFMPQKEIRHMIASQDIRGESAENMPVQVPAIWKDPAWSDRFPKTTANASRNNAKLEAQRVGFRYGGKGVWILKDIDLAIEPGERVGLVGPSGCGKSTLSKLLSGYETPTSGQVLWNGEMLPQSGYCPVQMIYQHPEMAVDINKKMQSALCEGWIPDTELLEAIEIRPEWLTRWPTELSGGELQRVCVARALGPQTKFLLADEMSTMLDVITQAQIWNVVLDIVKKRNIGLLVVTHNEALAKRVCTRMIDLTKLNRICSCSS